MTPFSKVYNSFLREITDDMYMELTPQDTVKLLNELLISAIPWFEFPRKPLDISNELQDVDDEEDGYFVADLTDEEIKILAIYMVVEWVGQQLANIDVVRMKYSGPDFKLSSQAMHLGKLQSLQKEYERKGFHLQRLYKRRKKDAHGIYRSTMHTLMEPVIYPFSQGNEDPSASNEKEGYWYDED